MSVQKTEASKFTIDIFKSAAAAASGPPAKSSGKGKGGPPAVKSKGKGGPPAVKSTGKGGPPAVKSKGKGGPPSFASPSANAAKVVDKSKWPIQLDLKGE